MMPMKNQDEINLINFFTRNKSLTRAQRARFASLVARDCIKSNDEVLENVEKKSKDTDTSLRFHNPKGVIEFLRLFSTDDILKWFTHNWDNQSKELTLHNLWRQLLETKSKKLSELSFGTKNIGIPASLYYHVVNFISSNPKGTLKDQHGERFETTWKDLKVWCEENPNVWPGSFITSEGVSFESVINRFKRTIEYRTDCEITEKFGMQIRKLISETIIGAVKVEFTPQFRELGRDINLYNYVNNFVSGIKQVCDWISSYKSKGDTLIVDMSYHDTYYLLTMFHKGSYFSGDYDKINGLSGDFKKLRELLFSVCDFSMFGEKNGQSLEIIALDNESKMQGSEIISETKVIKRDKPIGGVLYSFKLYR